MRRIALAGLVCACMAPVAPVYAQDAQRGGAGSVSGNVYLVMQSGDTKRGSGVTVSLLRDTKDLERWRNILCPQRELGNLELQIRRSKATDSLTKALDPWTDAHSRTKRRIEKDLYEKEKAASEAQLDSLRRETIREMRESLAAALVDTVSSGMEAHYQFANVPPGDYVVFAEWAIGDNRYAWWAPVEVRSGQSVKRDLDNSTEESGQLYCGAPPG